MIGDSYDEEFFDPHGECAREIKSLQSALALSEKRAEELERSRDSFVLISDQYRAERDSARSSLARVVEALTKYQWTGIGGGQRFCPACRKAPTIGHAENCEIRSALHRSRGGD